ncbi:MAG: hypothetical protein ACF8MJ_04970 [Phycisphaerales bacterium JB050]
MRATRNRHDREDPPGETNWFHRASEPVKPSEYFKLLWPALVGAPLSFTLAAAERNGTSLATAAFVVIWLTVSAFRLKGRSKLAPLAIYATLVIYSFLMSYLLVVITLDGESPFAELKDLLD